MIVSLLIGYVEHRTNFKFDNVDVFETYIDATDADYDSQDVIVTGWLCQLNTLEFNRVNRGLSSNR